MEREMKNKTVVVTGAAEGLGYEITKNFLKADAKLAILLDINEDKGRKAVEELTKEFGDNKAVFIKCNVVEDLDPVFKKIIEDFGQVDVLVNSAGVVNETDPQKCIDINLTATVKWSLKFYQHMRKDNKGNGGTIVNISSVFGYRIDYTAPVYHASKFGVFGFTKSLGHEKNFEKTGVRVIGICPGFTKTSMTKYITESEHEAMRYYKEAYAWQLPDFVGVSTLDVFKTADSGTMWFIEGGEMGEIK